MTEGAVDEATGHRQLAEPFVSTVLLSLSFFFLTKLFVWIEIILLLHTIFSFVCNGTCFNHFYLNFLLHLCFAGSAELEAV